MAYLESRSEESSVGQRDKLGVIHSCNKCLSRSLGSSGAGMKARVQTSCVNRGQSLDAHIPKKCLCDPE